MKVLIIDDSPDALDIAEAHLAKEHVDTSCAEGGRAGLEAAKRERPDLILLDLDMPGLSGFSVCRALKADAELRMIPVIFLSGSGGRDDKVRGLDLGAVDYITKPFDASELRARVRAALRTKRLQDLLVHHSMIDPLTELWNRRALLERLRQEWSRVDRYGGCLALAMSDVDHFKRVNDTHGHHVGDEVCRRIAGVFARWSRACDLPARYGGEEFAVLLPDQDLEGAAGFAERCRREIMGVRMETGGGPVGATASFGVAQAADAASAEALIANADAALYAAKRAGRNCVRGHGATAPVSTDAGEIR